MRRGGSKCVLGLFTFCVYYLTPIHTHTHTHRASERARDRCVARFYGSFIFFDSSFALPAALGRLLFRVPPNNNTIISFHFISLRFEPSLTHKLSSRTRREREKERTLRVFFGFFGLCFVFRFFLSFW